MRKFITVVAFLAVLLILGDFYSTIQKIKEENVALQERNDMLARERMQAYAVAALEGNDSNDYVSDTQSIYVYVSRTGTKYHCNPNCSNMSNPYYMTIDEAIAMGRKPCSKCY